MERVAVITDIHANLSALEAMDHAIARALDDCGCAYRLTRTSSGRSTTLTAPPAR